VTDEREAIATGPERLKVLDLGQYIAGSFVATLLGDLGAEVIKVERPGVGDRARGNLPAPADDPRMSYEWQVEKRSTTLDVANPKGHELLTRLVSWADVVVQNFRLDTAEKLGLGYEALRAVNPRVVYVGVSGFGATGPYRDRTAFDYVACAFGGLTYTTGNADAPATPGFAVADYMAGVFGALGALEAIRRRDAVGGSGTGEWVDIGLYEPIIRFSTPWLTAYARDGLLRERDGIRQLGDREPPPFVWGDTFRTADDQWIAMLPIQHTDRLQQGLFEAMDRPELMDDPRFRDRSARLAHLDALSAVVREWCATQPRAAVLAKLAEVGTACAPVNSIEDLAADPQVVERNLVTVPDHRGEPLIMQGVVPRLVGRPGEVRWAGEELGASNEAVFLDLLGLPKDEYLALVTDGVI
jgi:crotonobetainyl-CoA:carnitine CoA-transferase CaiB-like acyl-CoA transferase